MLLTTEPQDICNKMFELNERNRQFNRNRDFKTPFSISLVLHDYNRKNKE